jgi:hypothetical protein
VKECARSRCFKAVKLVGIIGSGQSLVQLIAFLSGLAIIRLLSVEQYALYTLTNAMLGTMGILADGGISAGVMVQGGRVWQDKLKLGSVVACGLQLRRHFAVVSFVVTAPILLLLLVRNGASWGLAALLVLAMLPAFIAALSTRLLDVPLRLHEKVWPIQRIFISAGLFRLGAIIPILLAWPSAIGAILLNGLIAALANVRLRQAAAPYADNSAEPDPEARKLIVALVRRTLPNAIYYCFSTQLTIWLVSIFGSASAVAQVGALSRIGLALAVVKSVVMTLLVPRFTKLSADSPFIVFRFMQVQATLWLLLFAAITAVYVFAKPLLWVLGPEYQGLKLELLLMALSSMIGLAAFTTLRLNESRGWVLPPQYFIPAALVLQVTLAAALKPSSAAIAFVYAVCIQLVTYGAYLAFFISRAVRK